MKKQNLPNVEIIDLHPGLWIWRLEHPAWSESEDWQQVVTCICVESGSEWWVIDPLLPADHSGEVWRRLDARPPSVVAVISPDHVRCTWSDLNTRSMDVLVRRYGCRAFGPGGFETGAGAPDREIEVIVPGEELPGGLRAFRDPRGWQETPLWLPNQRVLVFADALTERAGELRVWMSPTHEERAVGDLRAMLDLPFERLIISHGNPVHTRAELEDALQRPPWPAGPLHLAAYRADFDKVRRLVAAGANLAELDERFHATALSWAHMGARDSEDQGLRHQEIISFLKRAEADGGRD